MKTTIILGCLPFMSIVIANSLPVYHQLAQRQLTNDTSVSSTSTGVASTTTTIAESTRSTTIIGTTTSAPQSTSQPTTTSSAPPQISSTTTTIAPSSDAVTSTTTTSVSQTGVPTLSGVSSSNNPFSSAASSAITTTQSAATLVTTISKILSTSSSSSSTKPSPSTSSSAADSTPPSTGGLSKSAIIGISVAASVIAVIIIAWTLFRKLKLRPSNRFNRKLDAFDFGNNPAPHDDDFFEKTLNRTASQSSAERQRKALVAEEFDNPASTHVPGVPEHDFTAGGNYQAGYGMYNADPFAHSAAYDYTQDATQYNGNSAYPPQSYDQYGNPLPTSYDYPTQDQPQPHDPSAAVYAHGGGSGSGGYADLKRGNSNGSSGHGHAVTTGSQDHGYGQNHSYGNYGQTHAINDQQEHRVYPGDFPDASQYLGRPTGGSDGPYAQASTYRY